MYVCMYVCRGDIGHHLHSAALLFGKQEAARGRFAQHVFLAVERRLALHDELPGQGDTHCLCLLLIYVCVCIKN